MKRVFASLVTAVVALAVLIAGCSPAAPAPTQAPVAPTKAAEPTKAAAPAAPTTAPAAPQPTAAPAKKVDFPEKGKTITIIVPWGAGGDSDLLARVLAPPMEKDLGVQVQVVNKPGAGTQLGLTDLVKAKPDGYTLAFTNTPTTAMTYLDPERKSAYTRKDFAPVANLARTITTVGVPPDSRFKSVKDLVDAGKAEPEKVKVATTGLMTNTHLDLARFQKEIGVKFAVVHFDGAGPARTALAGGHVDASFQSISTWGGDDRAGRVRILGVMASKRSSFLPDVPTAEEQGFKFYAQSLRMLATTGGTPAEVIAILSGSVKKALQDPEVKKIADQFYVDIDYMDPAQTSVEWDKSEVEARDGIQLAKQQQ